MRRTRETIKTEYIDSDGQNYNVKYFIYVGGNLKDYEQTAEKAEATAKKYIHIGDVKIVVQYSRTFKTLPCQPVCT